MQQVDITENERFTNSWKRSFSPFANKELIRGNMTFVNAVKKPKITEYNLNAVV